MEPHRVRAALLHSPLGGEKQQMLDLNRRLETYLSRVKLLEEENALLAKEIQGLRLGSRRGSMWKKGLEEELRRARLDVDVAWRDRVHTEMDVGRLIEEVQALEQQRHGEARAQAKAKTKLEQSRKELQGEQRAQIRLREQVNQLEHQRSLLIQAHQEDVAHMEAASTQSIPAPPSPAQRSNRAPNLLQLGQEYSQRAAGAWQEAAEAYQGQLARLEESLTQTGGQMTQLGRQRGESQMKLQALEKELASAQESRLHLERTVSLQAQNHQQDIQHVQDHLLGLQAEKEELGQQMDRLLQENRGLMQVKMSLGLEVATYRALLDSGRLWGDIIVTDPVFNPRGVKSHYQTQMTINQKTTFLPPVQVRAGVGPTATPAKSKRPLAPGETPTLATRESPSPKIMRDGAVENVRPQEVLEKVAYAEPLSPPSEQEALLEVSEDKEVEEDWSVAVNPPEERPLVEAGVSCQVESVLGTEPPLNEQFTTPNLTPYHVMMTEENFSFSDESEKDVGTEAPTDDQVETEAPTDDQVETEAPTDDQVEESSDSETVAIIEPNFESWTSSPASEFEPEESVSDEVTDFTKDGSLKICQEASSSTAGGNEMEVDDGLYPDGEEMDTWDSVTERKADLTRDDGIEKDEDHQQHAETEDDLSPKELERERTETRQGSVPDAQRDVETMDKWVDDEEGRAVLDHATLPDNDGDEEDDSHKVSMSWRTELESDSYAQDNTLADTRPLIRYKSDDTDANVHMEESESSDGEQEKRMGEMGLWSEGESRRFGTMEDLCEDIEEDALDEEYDLGYTQPVGCGLTGSEGAPGNGPEHSEEMTREVVKGHLDEEREELGKPASSSNVDRDEGLDTDRLQEQDLENLPEDIYSSRGVSLREKRLHQHESIKQTQEESEETEPESPCVESEKTENRELASSTATTEQPFENLCFSDSLLSPTDEGQHKGQEAPEEREEEDECSRPMGNRDGTDHFRSDNPGLQGNLQHVAPPAQVKEVLPVEPPQELAIKDVPYGQKVLETTEWEVLENPSEDSEIRDQREDGFTQSDLLDEGGCDEGGPDPPLEATPDRLPAEDHIVAVKNPTELLHTNENRIHSLIRSGVKNNFWVSSLETGAAYQPDVEAERANQNQGFADNLVIGDLEHQDVIKWNSRIDVDSSKARKKKKEQQEVHSEGLCRNDAEGELVHSEESEVEAWSSGEEPA
ncbi:nestin [Brachionichthys hirsutus]|uniref:nestin n=1 Tax=Brachionichthys hirsutus TaxID=412623 RepID=UPI00360446F6